jgi:hypothetical protein
VGFQCGTCYWLFFWRLEFCGGSLFIWKCIAPGVGLSWINNLEGCDTMSATYVVPVMVTESGLDTKLGLGLLAELLGTRPCGR